MFENISRSSPSDLPSPVLDRIRVSASVRLRLCMRNGRTSLADLREEDGFKVRFPRRAEGMEAVIINTGGGLAGGDRVRLAAELDAGALAMVTTPSAERVYGALAGAWTGIDISLRLAEGARLNWLPQETILFDGARLKRSMTVDMASSAHVLIAETAIFGRAARGETVASGHFADRWRIRRDGVLAFAEAVRLDGAIAEIMQRPAIAGGAHIVSTVLLASPEAENRLAPVRRALDGADCNAAASVWNGLLVIRALGRDNSRIRAMLESVLPVLSETALPRAWSS